MYSTGLLVVSNIKQIGKTLRAIEKHVKSLYIHLNIPSTMIRPLPSWGRLISQIYVDNNNMDMRILVGPLKQHNQELSSTVQMRTIDMLFSDAHLPEICENLRKQFNISNQTIYLEHDNTTNDICDYQNNSDEHKIYNTVVLGGTFDRIHLGHKVFLTQAVLRAQRRLVVGVTTSKMTASKTLPELILPVEERIKHIKEFLNEIDSTLIYDVVPIDDAFGPTKSDPDMDMIVVSAETMRGGEKVNEIRKQNNLKQLDIFCIEVVECSDTSGPKEAKISSSNTRMDLLGTRLRKPEPRPHLPNEPYIIGLTGGIGSGKSRMAERFEKFGAFILDCDKIAHEIYEPGQICYNKIVEHFGKDIIGADGRIDRTKLGPIVFGDKQQLEALNGIVWPELMAEVKRRIRNDYERNQRKVAVIEAAVLLKAGWDVDCHEVWSLIVSPNVAVQRIMDRNGLSEEEARKRIASQMDNHEVVARSHVVFSSQWQPDFTMVQAEKAWTMLMSELNNKSINSNCNL